MAPRDVVLTTLLEGYDPHIPVSVVDQGQIYDVEVEGSKVSVKMTMTAPWAPYINDPGCSTEDVVLLVPGETSGATQTAPLSQCLEGVDHLLLGSAQVKEKGVSVLREGFPAGIALEELTALFAVAPVANNTPSAPQLMVGSLLVGAKELTGIHGTSLIPTLEGHDLALQRIFLAKDTLQRILWGRLTIPQHCRTGGQTCWPAAQSVLQ